MAARCSPAVVRIRSEAHVFKPLGRYLEGLGRAALGLLDLHPWWEWPYRLLSFPFYALFGCFDLGSAEGSGFFVSEGLVVTNAHVVDNSASLLVELRDGRTAGARIRRCLPDLDLALLEVHDLNGKTPPPLTLRTGPVWPGEPVLAVGYPAREGEARAFAFGSSSQAPRPNPRLTVGVVSAVGVDLGNERTTYLETDAALNPGSSGGPLLDGDGAVVGVCSMIGVGKEDEGYAVPAASVLEAFAGDLTPGAEPPAPAPGED